MAFEDTAQKWALIFVGIFILVTIGSILLPIGTSKFSSNSNLTCTRWNTTTEECAVDTGVGCSDIPTNLTGIIDGNCMSNYSGLASGVSAVLIVVFIMAVLLIAVGALKKGHR